jgi:hypothetical protein
MGGWCPRACMQFIDIVDKDSCKLLSYHERDRIRVYFFVHCSEEEPQRQLSLGTQYKHANSRARRNRAKRNSKVANNQSPPPALAAAASSSAAPPSSASPAPASRTSTPPPPPATAAAPVLAAVHEPALVRSVLEILAALARALEQRRKLLCGRENVLVHPT